MPLYHTLTRLVVRRVRGRHALREALPSYPPATLMVSNVHVTLVPQCVVPRCNTLSHTATTHSTTHSLTHSLTHCQVLECMFHPENSLCIPNHKRVLPLPTLWYPPQAVVPPLHPDEHVLVHRTHHCHYHTHSSNVTTRTLSTTSEMHHPLLLLLLLLLP
jgi:hypothetical protein